jgi:hypothetical protein
MFSSLDFYLSSFRSGNPSSTLLTVEIDNNPNLSNNNDAPCDRPARGPPCCGLDCSRSCQARRVHCGHLRAGPALRKMLFNYAILGFALTEAIGLFALMLAFLMLFS